MPESRAAARYRNLLGLPEPVPAPPRPVTLSVVHQKVIDHWFAGGCLSRRDATTAAGLSPHSASAVFGRPEVQAEIERRRDRMDRKAEVTEERIIREYAKLAFASLGDLLEIQTDGSAWIDMSALTDEQKAALAEYNVETYHELGDENHDGREVKKSKIKFHDKKAALDSLARIRGMFKDKLEVSVGLTLSDKVQQARQRLSAAPVIEGELVS